jgi:hypothetical protein
MNGFPADNKEDLLAFPEQLFTCPITQQRLVDPVITPDGHTYSRAAIELWVKDHKTDPSTGKKLEIKNLRPDKLTANLLTAKLVRFSPDQKREPVLLLDKAKLKTESGSYYSNPIANHAGAAIEQKQSNTPYPHRLLKQLTTSAQRIEHAAVHDEKEGVVPDHKIDINELAAAKQLWSDNRKDEKEVAAQHDVAPNIVAFSATLLHEKLNCSLAYTSLEAKAVISPNGNQYNLSSITQWLQQKASCPFTRAPLQRNQLRPISIPNKFKIAPVRARDINGNLLLIVNKKLFVVDAQGLIAEADEKNPNPDYQYRLLNDLIGISVERPKPAPQARAAQAAAAVVVEEKKRDDRDRPPLPQAEGEVLIGPLAAAGNYGAVDMRRPLIAPGEREGEPEPINMDQFANNGAQGELAMEAKDVEELRIRTAKAEALVNELAQERETFRREIQRQVNAAKQDAANAQQAAQQALQQRDNAEAALEAEQKKCSNSTKCLGILAAGGVFTGIGMAFKHGGSSSNDGPTPPTPTPVDPTLSYTSSVLGQNYNQICLQAQGGDQPLRFGAWQVTYMDEQATAVLPATSGISLFPDGSTFASTRNSDGGYSTTVTLPTDGVSLSDGQQACARMNTAFQGATINIGGIIPKNAPVFVDGNVIPIAGRTNITDPTPGIRTSTEYTTWGGADPTKLPVDKVNTIVLKDPRFDNTGAITVPTYTAAAQVRTLQLQNPDANTEADVFLGGYGTGDTTAQIASNNATRATFVNNARGMVQQGFDGLMLDPDLVGATKPISGADLVSLATDLTSSTAESKTTQPPVPKLIVVVPGSEYGLTRLQPPTALCDVAALPNVEIVRATNDAYGSSTTGQSITDDQTPLNVDPNNPTSDRTSSFVGGVDRLRQLCPKVDPKKFSGTIYTDGIVTSVSTAGPQGNGRWAPPVTSVGDKGFVPLNDIVNGNYPAPGMQCTFTGQNPAYSNVTQTPYCFAPATDTTPAVYTTFTDARSAELLAKAAKASGHGRVTISSSSGKAGDAPIGSGNSITDAVSTVFAPSDGTGKKSSATAPQIATTVSAATESKTDNSTNGVSLTSLANDFQTFLTDLYDAAKQGKFNKEIAQSFLLTLQTNTLAEFLTKRGYSKEQILWINQATTAALLLATGASATVTVSTVAITALLAKSFNLDHKNASAITSALLATTHLLTSSLGVAKTAALFGVSTAINAATSIATSRVMRPITSAAASVASYAYSKLCNTFGFCAKPVEHPRVFLPPVSAMMLPTQTATVQPTRH